MNLRQKSLVGTIPHTLVRRPPGEVEAAVRAGAERHGMDPDLAVAIARSVSAPSNPPSGGLSGRPPRVAKPTIERLVDDGGNNAEYRQQQDCGPAPIPYRKRDDRGPLRMLVCSEGYAMVRRPGAMVFVMTVKEWLALDDVEN